MATAIAIDVCIHQPVGDYERAVIEANRRMADLRIVRGDYRNYSDGLRRFLRHVEKMERQA